MGVADVVRVGIVGGSIAGCASAVVLSRASHEVTVFERSPDQLISRGAGIGTPADVLKGMIEGDRLDATFPRLPTTGFRHSTVVVSDMVRG